eukprot:UN02961
MKDSELIEMDMNPSFIRKLRQKIPYEKETWQTVLYELKLGEHVLTLEQRGVKELNGMTDSELIEIEMNQSFIKQLP